MTLLFAAALFSRSFVRLIDTDQGFRMPAVLATDVQIPWAKYKENAQRGEFYDRVLARLRSQPGVLSAAFINAVPLTGETWVDVLSVPGDNRPDFEKPPVNVRMASPDYFDTMGIPVLSGRTFTDKDKDRKVVMVSERVAHLLWPRQGAIGRQIVDGGNTYEVIAVVGDVRAEAHKAPVLTVYRTHWSWPGLTMKLVARAAGDPRSIAGAVRASVRSVDPDVPLAEMRTMREVLAQSVAQRKLQAVLTLVFAATALLLAGLGVYGVVAYSVSRRTNEMGIRIALGASARNLCAMVVRQAMLPVVLGVIVGLAAAFAEGRLLASLLYEVSPRDPVILSAVSVVLLAVGLAASLIPAVRAARSAPVKALHYE